MSRRVVHKLIARGQASGSLLDLPDQIVKLQSAQTATDALLDASAHLSCVLKRSRQPEVERLRAVVKYRHLLAGRSGQLLVNGCRRFGNLHCFGQAGSRFVDGISNLLRQLLEVLRQVADSDRHDGETKAGTVIAACFMSVVDDAKRFASAHQLESYLRLVPGENTSDGKCRLGTNTTRGNCVCTTSQFQFDSDPASHIKVSDGESRLNPNSAKSVKARAVQIGR